MADERTHDDLLEEHKLLQHEHETLKSEMGRELAELRASTIRVQSVNRRLLEDLEGKKNELASTASVIRSLEDQVGMLRNAVAESEAKAAAASDRYSQVVAKISELREAVKPLIAQISRA